MSRVGAGARDPNRARSDCQPAPARHRLGGVENQIQKGLLKLRRIPRNGRQIRLQCANVFDALIGQLVPHQQSQLVNQFVQVHR